MTAFAAIVARDCGDIDPRGLADVAGALSSLHSGPVSLELRSGCAMLSAPLHGSSPARPFVAAPRDVIVAGQVMLEGAADMRRQLPAPDASILSLVAAAYERWSVRCTHQFSGEFAFALWDSQQRLFLAARDGLGVRPLYIGEGPRVVVVSNILRAALAHPEIDRDLDDESLLSFLAFGAMDDTRTPFARIHRVPAGHTLVLREGASQVSLGRHWRFPHPRSRGRVPRASDVVDGYREVLQRAVADRLQPTRTSVLLSGGIDSTTIAAAARRSSPATDLRAFTAVYERIPHHDEAGFARAAAGALQMPLTPVPGDRHDALDAIWRGGPPAEPLNEPTLSDWRALAGAAASHAPVGLYGEDGDTLFLPAGWGGVRRESGAVQGARAAARYAVTERTLPYLGLRLRERLRLRPARVPQLTAPFLSAAGRAAVRSLRPPPILGRPAEPLTPHPTRPETQRRLSIGVSQYLSRLIAPETLDQWIELRCPLLDTRVIQFVMDVPAIPWCQDKRLPREAFRADLPERVIRRPKTGVSGLHERLVTQWQQHTARNLSLKNERLARWIDDAAWRRGLFGSDAVGVGLAWRALLLDAWISSQPPRRAGAGTPAGAALARSG